MEGSSFPLPGGISRLNKLLLEAEEDYIRRGYEIARGQREVRDKLLALAPEELHRHLRQGIDNLFRSKVTSFSLYAAGVKRSMHQATLLTELGIAWQGAIEVETLMKPSRNSGMRFIVHLRASPHTSEK